MRPNGRSVRPRGPNRPRWSGVLRHVPVAWLATSLRRVDAELTSDTFASGLKVRKAVPDRPGA